MTTAIRTQLINLARLRTTWSYSQLNDQLQLGLNFSNSLDRDLIGEWLGEVSIHEYERGRPLISCLITHQYGMREQGDGFYKLCEQLYGTNWESLKTNKTWENQLIAECYEFWLAPDNYRNFKNDW
ncbi:hypothetical protein [Dyadobacter sp.]|uniref:hypothetical protein n=1 Tax=Dyadobacter sp. TaxID=1914288 RepID=UPI003F70788A